MTTRTHIVAFVVVVLAALSVLRVVRAGGLRSKYALVWGGVGVLLIPLAAFSGLLRQYSHLIGVQYPPTALLLTAAGLLFMLSLHYSWELSRTETRLRRLAEEVALLLDAIEVRQPDA